MKEIANRLHEKRQIELAKSILESHGYKIVKEATESYSTPDYRTDYVIYSGEPFNVETQMYYSSDEDKVLEFIKSNPNADYVLDPMMDGTILTVFDFLIDCVGMSSTEAGAILDSRK